QRQRTMDVLITLLRELAARQPVLFIGEDLHWADPSMLEFLQLLVDQVPTTAMLLVLTYRPPFQPLYGAHTYVTSLTVPRLTPARMDTLITCVTGGKSLPTEVVEQITTKADGVPLFVEELTKAILESGQLREEGDRYVLTGILDAVTIPTT